MCGYRGRNPGRSYARDGRAYAGYGSHVRSAFDERSELTRDSKDCEILTT